MTSWRQSAAVMPSLLRALPRAQLGAGAIGALGVVWLLSDEPQSARTLLALQAAALMLSLAVASIFDDPASDTVAAVPLTLMLRRTLTLALALPLVVVAWTGGVWLSGVAAGFAGAMTLQMGALILVTLALAARLGRGGMSAGALVVLMFFGLQAAVPAWVIAPDFGDGRWDAIWVGLAAGALFTLLLVSRDPAHRRRRLTLRRSE